VRSIESIEEKRKSMTIKQRLFISHILMIIVPVLLSLLVSVIAILMVWRYFWGLDEGAMIKNSEFRNQYASVERLMIKWDEEDTTDKEVVTDLQQFEKEHHSDEIALLVYNGSKLVSSVGKVTNQQMKNAALNETGEHSYLKDQTFLTTFETNRYKVILMNSNYYNDLYYQDPLWDQNYQTVLMGAIILIVFLILSIIFITSRFLTRYMTRSITDPLELLTEGFCKVREGDWQVQIHYTKQDEFLPVSKDFNDMVHQLNQMMDNQNKLETNRRELIAGISHDLRTPLTSIKAYVEGLEKGIANTPDMRTKYFAIVKKKIADLDQIIAQLFLFSKLDTGEFPFNFVTTTNKKLIDEDIHFIQQEYESNGLTISLEANEIVVPLEVDPVQFRTVMTNLFENALKYVNRKEKQVRLAYEVVDNQFILSIIDNGNGVSEASLDDLFELFYRDDCSRNNPSNGNGLGLAISKKIIEGFNGTIRAYNHSEGGLAIVITLPVKNSKRK
jgi:signal transduction histidine kinase